MFVKTDNDIEKTNKSLEIDNLTGLGCKFSLLSDCIKYIYSLQQLHEDKIKDLKSIN